MKILLVHNSFPDVFRHVAARLAALPNVDVRVIAGPRGQAMPGIPVHRCKEPRPPSDQTHWYLRQTEARVLTGQAMAGAAINLLQNGFTPDLIFAHADSGEALYLRDVLRDVPLVMFCEWYERPATRDPRFAFDEAFDINYLARVRTEGINALISLEACTAAFTPTLWQHSLLPAELRSRVSVQHLGIDTKAFRPDAAASFVLPQGGVLKPGDEVVTFVADRLARSSGFPAFMTALAALLRQRPTLRAVVVGADAPISVPKGQPARTYRDALTAELGSAAARLHVFDSLPDEALRHLLQVSRVHVHLSGLGPLPASLLEAMAAGAAVVASDTPAVREVVLDGVNGLLTNFFEPGPLAQKIAYGLDHPTGLSEIRAAARATILSRFELGACTEAMVASLLRFVGTPRENKNVASPARGRHHPILQGA